MDEHGIRKTLLEMKTIGNRGRPRTQWLEQVKRDIERREQSWAKVKEMQEWKDEDSWRPLCKSQPMTVETT
jgi:hypothetical protein